MRGLRMARSRRGYLVPLVLVLLSTLLLLVAWVFSALDLGARSGRDLLRERRAFYGCDGLSRVAQAITADYLASTKGADADDLRDAICAAGGGCGRELLPDLAPEDFVVEAVEVSLGDDVQVGPMPSGALRGLSAERRPLSVEISGYLDDGADYRCRVERVFALGEISPFQYTVLVDGYLDWFPPDDLKVLGRVHANGDACFGSEDDFALDRVTTAGALLHPGNEGCRFNPTDEDARELGAMIATAPGFDDFEDFEHEGDHGCVECDGDPLSWPAWALQRWGGQALDGAHGAPPLRASFGVAPIVQATFDAGGVAIDNATRSRALVDPPTTQDSDGLLQSLRLAHQAHIRIVNGVWFLQDPDDPTSWPGLPIWSDRPGSFTSLDEQGVEGEVAVGLENIQSARAWGDEVPARYSYYRADPATGALLGPVDGEVPVISYGSLVREDDASWAPGHWVAAGAELCVDGAATRTGLFAAGDRLGCAEEAPRTAHLLNGTRSGFRDATIAAYADEGSLVGASVQAGDAEILPINLDVAALLAALQDGGLGELGSYFCLDGGGCLMNEPFNGIVYVTATWPGSGLFGEITAPLLPPEQGDQGPLSGTPQPLAAAHEAGQQALPFPLCAIDGDVVGEPLEASGSFVSVTCRGYEYTGLVGGGARPGALRLIHAHDLLDDADGDGQLDIDFDADGVPDGLTIATNLPVYVLGEVNATSETDDYDGGADVDDWSPFLLAADRVTLLSDEWDDAEAPWGSVSDLNDREVDDDNVYAMQILTGWLETSSAGEGVYGGGLETALGLLEDWDDADLEFTGSLVVGYSSVYARWPASGEETAWEHPDDPLVPRYDPHLDHPALQPPGEIPFTGWSLERWARD